MILWASPIFHPTLSELEGFHQGGRVDRVLYLPVHLDHSDQQIQLIPLGRAWVRIHQIVNPGQRLFVVFFRFDDLRDHYNSSESIAPNFPQRQVHRLSASHAEKISRSDTSYNIAILILAAFQDSLFFFLSNEGMASKTSSIPLLIFL